jgi:hypothetical protein
MLSAQEGWMFIQSVQSHGETTETLHYQNGTWQRGLALPAPTSPVATIVTALTQGFGGEAWALGSVALNTDGTTAPTISDQTATVVFHLHDGQWEFYNPYPHSPRH